MGAWHVVKSDPGNPLDPASSLSSCLCARCGELRRVAGIYAVQLLATVLAFERWLRPFTWPKDGWKFPDPPPGPAYPEPFPCPLDEPSPRHFPPDAVVIVDRPKPPEVECSACVGVGVDLERSTGRTRVDCFRCGGTGRVPA